MVRRLGVGICGLGAFGESHLRAFRGLPHAEVVAVASRSAARARAVAAHHGVPRWYESYEAMIADPAVEAITVTTAEAEHVAPALAALAAGKPVLVEKPLATTAVDGRALLAASVRSSTFLMPGHILRFEAKYAAMKAAVAAGELGQLTALSARRNRPRSLVASHGRVHPALVTAIHDLDIMLWLADRPLRSVRAVQRIARRPGEPHGIWALLRFDGDIVATLEAVWMIPDAAATGPDDAFSAIGTEGMAQIQLSLPSIRMSTNDGMRVPDVSYEPTLHGATAGALKEELAYFTSRALSGDRPTVVTAQDGYDALMAALALIDSAERDCEISLEREAAPEIQMEGQS